MDADDLAELAGLYEEYLHGQRPACDQAKAIFEAKVKKLYGAEPESYRKQVSYEKFRDAVIAQVDAYLNKPQTKFPTVTPEKRSRKR